MLCIDQREWAEALELREASGEREHFVLTLGKTWQSLSNFVRTLSGNEYKLIDLKGSASDGERRQSERLTLGKSFIF